MANLVAQALQAGGQADEHVVMVVEAVPNKGRRLKWGKDKAELLALTADTAGVVRVREFKPQSTNPTLVVPKNVWPLSAATRIDGDDDVGISLEFDTGTSVYRAFLSSNEQKREFVWCCLQVRLVQGSMPAHNVDFVELSMWAQARRLDEEYGSRHAIFRPGETEAAGVENLNNPIIAAASSARVLMTEQEELDILELMQESDLSFADVKEFEIQLAHKLERLEETNIESVLESDSVVDDVIFQLDHTTTGVSDLIRWMDDINRGLLDIQDGISEIKQQNNKLGTMHRNNTALEGLLDGVLCDLSLPDDCLALLQSGELNTAEDLEQMLPAARRLVHGVSLELSDGMQNMLVVQSQKAEFERLRGIFSAKAHRFLKRTLEQDKDLARIAHLKGKPGWHALSTRAELYGTHLRPAVQLLQVLHTLDRLGFEKILRGVFVKSMRVLNKANVGGFFRQIRETVERRPRDCQLVAFSEEPDGVETAAAGPSPDAIEKMARAGVLPPGKLDLAQAFQYALDAVLQHCHQEHIFLRTFFESGEEIVNHGHAHGGDARAHDDLQHDLHECDRLMQDLYGDTLLEGLVALAGVAEKSDPMLVLTMLRRACAQQQRAGLDSREDRMHLVDDVVLALQRTLRGLVGQCVAEVDAYSVSAKRCGVLLIVANVPAWISRAERLLAGLSPDQLDHILDRGKASDGVEQAAWGPEEGLYSRLIHAVDAKLEQIAYSNDKYTFLVLMQNYGLLARRLRRHDAAPELAATADMAARCAQANLASYIDMAIEWQFGPLVAFFRAVEQSNVAPTEVQYQASFAPAELRRLLEPLAPTAIRRAVEEMLKKIARQLIGVPAGDEVEADDVDCRLPAVWAKAAQVFSARWVEWEQVCQQCYHDIRLPASAPDIAAAFAAALG